MKHNPSRYFMPHVALIDCMLWQNVHCLSYEGWHQQTGTNGGVGAGGKVSDSVRGQSGQPDVSERAEALQLWEGWVYRILGLRQ